VTVKELIDKLKGCDPEATVCTGGNDSISSVEALPAYYDGRLRKVVEDEDGTPVRVEVNGHGGKVKIHSYDIEDVVFNYPRIEVVAPNMDGLLESCAEYRQEGLDYERSARKKYDHYSYLDKYDGHLFVWDVEEIN